MHIIQWMKVLCTSALVIWFVCWDNHLPNDDATFVFQQNNLNMARTGDTGDVDKARIGDVDKARTGDVDKARTGDDDKARTGGVRECNTM